jgi:hypothetical protein
MGKQGICIKFDGEASCEMSTCKIEKGYVRIRLIF